MVIVTEQRIQIIVEYLTKGLARANAAAKKTNEAIVRQQRGYADASKTGKRMRDTVQRNATAQSGFFKTMRMNQKELGQFNKQGYKMTSMGGRMANRFRMMTHGARGFRMEMLGVMFFGMMLYRTFSGLIKQSLAWMGVNEILTTSLGLLFLPVAEWMLEWALKFLDWVSNLTENQKKWIGSIVLIGIAIGGILFLLGSFALGIGSLILAFGWLLSPIGLVLAAFVAMAGFFILKDFFGDVGTASDKLKTKLMAFGVSGDAFDKVKDKIVGVLPKIKEFFIGLKDKIGTWIMETLPTFIKSAGDIVMSLARGLIENAPKIANAVVILITKIADFISKNLSLLLTAAYKIITVIVKGIADNAPKLVDAVIVAIKTLADLITEYAPQLWDSTMKIIQAIIDGVTENAEMLREASLKVLHTVSDLIIKNLPILLDAALELVETLVDGMIDNMDAVYEVIMSLIEMLGKFIGENIDRFVELGVKIAIAIVKGLAKALPGLVKSALGALWDLAKGAFKFGEKIGGYIMGSRQYGGYIPKTGPYLLHKGETVVPAETTNTFSPNITINATISSDYDVRRLAEELKRYWVSDFERVSKGRGI